MNTQQFIDAYNESRNGTDAFHFNPLYPKFLYSDGVRECAAAGCYWLLDILGTELPGAFAKRQEAFLCIVTVTVKNESAKIVGEFEDDEAKPYRKSINYTDLPEGKWIFYVSKDEGKLHCILPKEY